METAAPKRLLKYSTAPILGEDGKPVFIRRLTALDDRMIEPLAWHRFLTAAYIAAYAGTSADYVTDRFKYFKRKPNYYVKIADWQMDDARQYQNWPHYYELEWRGKERLEVRGIEVRSDSYQGSPDHQIMLDQAIASFHLAEKERPDELRLVPWASIASSPNLSPEARQSVARSHAIPISVRLDGTLKKVNVEADGYPFGYELKRAGKYVFFPGIEVEYARKRRDTGDLTVQSLRLKFLKHAGIIDQEVYRSYFGFRLYYVPFIFASPHDMKAAMQQLERMVGRGEIEKQTGEFILFKYQPAPGSYDKPSPTGHMVTEPWARVGFPPFCILQ